MSVKRRSGRPGWSKPAMAAALGLIEMEMIWNGQERTAHVCSCSKLFPRLS